MNIYNINKWYLIWYIKNIKLKITIGFINLLKLSMQQLIRSILFSYPKPINRSFFNHLVRSIRHDHAVFRLSNIRHTFYHLANEKYQIHVFCHIGIHLHKIFHQSRLFYLFSAFCYFPNRPHIVCFQTIRIFLYK